MSILKEQTVYGHHNVAIISFWSWKHQKKWTNKENKGPIALKKKDQIMHWLYPPVDWPNPTADKVWWVVVRDWGFWEIIEQNLCKSALQQFFNKKNYADIINSYAHWRISNNVFNFVTFFKSKMTVYLDLSFWPIYFYPSI